MLPKLIRGLFIVASSVTAVFVLNSCMSSSNDPDDGGASTNGGGIGGSGFVDVAAGDITGFGSVIVNNVLFDTSQATFTVNGMPAEQSDLRVGMNVTAAVDLQNQVAGSISYTPNVVGPVTTTSLEAGTFQVLGQTIVVDSSTVLDEISLEGNASNVIAEGAIIEVSGIRNANNDVVATYVRRADSVENYLLQGIIEAEVSDDLELLIDGVLVDVSGIDPAQFNIGAEVGDFISLSLSPNTVAATALDGSSVLSIPSLNELLTRLGGTKIRVEGFITNNVFNVSFSFGDLFVVVGTNTVFRFADGTPAKASDLGDNSRIELIATTQGIGVVVPDEIIIIEP